MEAKDDAAMYDKTFLQEASHTINTLFLRAPVDPIDSENEDFTFMCIDVDHYIDKPPSNISLNNL